MLPALTEWSTRDWKESLAGELEVFYKKGGSMGIYLNPGNKNFWKAIRSEIYVDKTELIAYTNKYLNTKEQFICVSRPRRFGKSMA